MFERKDIHLYSRGRLSLSQGQANYYLLFVLMLLFTLISGCSDVNHIYVDIKQQAIISCDGTGLKRLSIENDSETIVLEGTESIIRFNQVNNILETSVNGKTVNDYNLTLRKNYNYTIKKENGYDRGPITVTFKTDNLGKIVTASDTKCD